MSFAQVHSRENLNGFFVDYWSLAIMLWMMHTGGTCVQGELESVVVVVVMFPRFPLSSQSLS